MKTRQKPSFASYYQSYYVTKAIINSFAIILWPTSTKPQARRYWKQVMTANGICPVPPIYSDNVEMLTHH